MKWVALAEAAETDDGIECHLLRMIEAETDILDRSSADEATKRVILDRLQRLEEFTSAASALADKLRQHVRQLERTEDEA